MNLSELTRPTDPTGVAAEYKRRAEEAEARLALVADLKSHLDQMMTRAHERIASLIARARQEQDEIIEQGRQQAALIVGSAHREAYELLATTRHYERDLLTSLKASVEHSTAARRVLGQANQIAVRRITLPHTSPGRLSAGPGAGRWLAPGDRPQLTSGGAPPALPAARKDTYFADLKAALAEDIPMDEAPPPLRGRQLTLPANPDLDRLDEKVSRWGGRRGHTRRRSFRFQFGPRRLARG